MHNHLLKERTARDIDTLIERLLADLGNPEPPLRLEVVRDRLKLDRGYYSATDGGALRDTAHCLIVAGKQVVKRPMLLWEVVKKCDLKALFLPDQKRILIDSALPDLKKRWAEAHEVAHDLIPWHERLSHGDPLHTLSHECHIQVEAEANFATGRMLFLRDRFTDDLFGSPVTFERIRKLSKAFGNTMTSGLWRSIELIDQPAIGLVSCHPWTTPDDLPERPVRHLIRNQPFENQFANITEEAAFRLIAQVVRRRGGGPIGEKEMPLTDIAGEQHVFGFECFSNTHETLTLGLYRKKKPVAVVVPAAPATITPRTDL